MNFEMFFRALRNELLKLCSRKRSYLGFVVFVLTEFIVVWLWNSRVLREPLTTLLDKNGLRWEDCSSALSIACFAVSFGVGLVAGLYLALVGGDLVAKEFEEGTIRMVMARPISRARLFAVKAMAGAAYTFVLALFVGASSLAVGWIGQHRAGSMWVYHPLEKVSAVYSAGEGLQRYAVAILVLALSYQAISALALMCSCLKIKPATATVLTLSYLSVDFGFYSIPFFAPHHQWFLSHHVSCWVRVFQYQPPWHSIATSLVLLAAISASCWLIGLACFSARDIKT